MVKNCPMSRFPVRLHAFCLMAPWVLPLAWLVSPEAQAGVLYRCTDKHGATAYTSTREGYRQCRLMGNFAPGKATSNAPATPEPPTQKTVEFRTAAGDAEPKAVPQASGSRSQVTRGAVYKFEKNGVTHYTNRRPAGARAQVLFTYIETCFACSASPGLDFQRVGLNLTAYADEITAAAARHGVDEALVRAVIHAESAFNPNAVSHAGAQGLMQLMPATASRFGVGDPFLPGQNIDGGVEYLAWLSRRFNGDLTRVAAGYNAGEGAVDRYDGVPPYQETIRYVERVGILRDRYSKELASRTNPAAASVSTAATAPAGVAAGP